MEENKTNIEMKENNKGLIIIIISVLAIAVASVVLVFIFNDNKETVDSNKQGNEEIVDCFKEKEDSFEINRCITSNIEKGHKYTKEELLNNGYAEIDINNVDINSNIVKELTNFNRMDDRNRLEVKSVYDGKVLYIVEINNNVATLSYYSKEGTLLKQQTINNIIAIKHNESHNEQSTVFLLSSTSEVYKLYVDQHSDYERINNNDFKGLLFEKVTVVNNVNDVYYLLNHSYTLGANISYLVKTKDNVYKYIDDGKVYDINTYKVVNENVKIMNNRDIYLNEKVESYKLKMEYVDTPFYGKVNYILSNENYLYDANLNLVHDKKVVAILKGETAFNITIFEDGKNLTTDFTEIQ